MSGTRATLETGVTEPIEDESGTDFDLGSFPGGAKSAIEAVLMVVDEPVSAISLASAIEITVDEVTAHLNELESEYAAAHRGFTLRSVGGGWRIYSRADYAPVVEKFLLDGQQARLTQAALETLAVIAYRQPVSRGRVGAVRGVNVDGVIRTLLTRGLIEELEEPGEGGSILYGTTPYFLERMGLSSLDELPAIAPFLPELDALDDLPERGRG
jgi:segregation and condensation protein B